MMAGAIVLGTAFIAYPFLPGPEAPATQSVEANIRACHSIYQRRDVITWSTNIDQPPGEVRWVTDPASRKMIDGYRAACESGKPVRIDYVRSTASTKESYWIRGIAGVDGTDYFSVADGLKAEMDDRRLGIPIGIFLYLVAFGVYFFAKIIARQEAEARAKAARRKMV